MAHVLLADDDRDLLEVHRIALEALGHRVTTATSGEETWEALSRVRPDILVLDCMMEEFTTGFTLSQDIARAHPDVPIVLLTSVRREMSQAWSFARERDADWLPVARFLDKPIRGEELDREIRSLLIRSAAS